MQPAWLAAAPFIEGFCCGVSAALRGILALSGNPPVLQTFPLDAQSKP
jgi:hypothetical protein